MDKPIGLAAIIDAVAWAKTCFVIASHADGDEKFKSELAKLEAANERVRDLTGLEISHLPHAVQLEIKICEKGIIALRQQGDVSSRRKAKRT